MSVLLIFFSLVIIGIILLIFCSDVLEKIFSFMVFISRVFQNLFLLVVYFFILILAIIIIISIFE